ncbi:GNAT family N-acetyltransferase [Winogradskyella echinorum]|uniref:GNAT family N-acetyltransferase n=1 Tax=Winogradskyella echinorum TaxID=538189 RepID=A0ABR6Y2I9_9FLAO|nr:GNAT family N-acetyltransferase [Winogradskyella echinorum]MBC3846453.1 GNAT family N-acetyltransferase [Winogradskyella echinorum]MBC5750801.1 GNAT family N-acetyltransferase [Winogradskyella echinorum]
MIDIIKDKKTWNENLALAKDSDFYYTYDYHHLSKTDDESPVLIKYTEGSTTLVLPLLLRDIENSDYKDATSVYGYAGVLALQLDNSFNKANFHKELNAFFIENKIVSVFSRLHPYIDNQETLLTGLGEVKTMSDVVCIDLTDTIENQRAKFNRRLKTYLNKSRKSCTVIEGNVDEHLETFVELYHENMRRVDADDSYFFSDKYYREIMTSSDFKSELMLCVHNETQTIIGGAIFIKKGDIVQYHLSGLSEAYFDLNPIKLVIDEVRIRATEEGYKYFNLGGGRGSSEDSLFRFKSGFSKDFKKFKVWKYVVNQDAYQALVEQNLDKQLDGDDLYSGFFPAYRKPIEVSAS